jgi:MFS family permease
MAIEQTEPRAASFAARHFRWNVSVLLVDACGYFLGLSFFEPSTVLPVLMTRLGAADWQVGLMRFVQTTGIYLPALFAAHIIHGLPRHKPFLITTALIGRIGVLILPIALWFFGVSKPGIALAALFATVSLFFFMEGFSLPSWFDIVAKTIDSRVRGRFFGAMQLMNGILAIGAGSIVAIVLATQPFPRSYAILAGLWCAGLIISQIALAFIREPEGVADEEEKPSFTAFVRRAGPMFRGNFRLRRLIASRLLIDAMLMASPFYVLYAQRALGAPAKMVGIYVLIQSLGRITTGPIIGLICDRFGPPIGVRCAATAAICVPIIALSGVNRAFPAVFFLLGALQDAVWIVSSSTLLESVEPKERPFAIGVYSLMLTPSALYGLVGGLIAQATSYRVVFTCALAIGTIGAISAFRIPSVRQPASE